MTQTHLLLSWVLVSVLAAAACAPTSSPRDGASSAGESPRSGPLKRITAAVPAELPMIHSALTSGAGGQGRAIQELAVAGLTIYDPRGQLHPQLAEVVPSPENGLWKVFPDGRMETTWRIREGAIWHDGTPFTAQDLVFTAAVVADPELPVFSNVNYRGIEGVDAPDPRTITVRWKAPFIKADGMFGQRLGAPFPRHLLESAYTNSKSTFTDLPYWGPEFVGTGPFRLVELDRGSHLLFQAFDGFVLGRPKVDQVEVRFILDESAIVASILAGAVDMTLARGLGPEHGFTLRAQWRSGHVEWDQVGSWFVLYPQYLDTNPPVILDARFRRALLHATDRPELAEALIGDATGVPHSLVHPLEPEYAEVQSSIVRYDYDPRRAAQLVESTGYVRGSDGFYADAGGRRLQVELNTTPNDAHLKMLAALGDAWGRQGIGTEQFVVPRQRALDAEFRATFPAFSVLGHPVDIERLHSREARTAERNFQGLNHARYANPELDALIDSYFATVPKAERNRFLAQIVRHVTDLAVVLPMAWRADPTPIAARLVNVGAKGPEASQAWNSYQWDVRN